MTVALRDVLKLKDCRNRSNQRKPSQPSRPGSVALQHGQSALGTDRWCPGTARRAVGMPDGPAAPEPPEEADWEATQPPAKQQEQGSGQAEHQAPAALGIRSLVELPTCLAAPLPLAIRQAVPAGWRSYRLPVGDDWKRPGLAGCRMTRHRWSPGDSLMNTRRSGSLVRSGRISSPRRCRHSGGER